jgi:hypothetical protein
MEAACWDGSIIVNVRVEQRSSLYTKVQKKTATPWNEKYKDGCIIIEKTGHVVFEKGWGRAESSLQYIPN